MTSRSRKARTVMVQGTGSSVGKSLIVAGLCRALTTQGLRVCPFKPQNMSNNAAVARGGEIGRAQALQAQACRVEPAVEMNPVLLKPETETGAQIVLKGRAFGRASAREYGKIKSGLLGTVVDCFEALRARADVVVVEGAGSPAEVNLRDGDIANMGFARATETPVILMGDIDRGGVIAQLVGTFAILDSADLRLVKGFAINRFRGDLALFADGYAMIEQQTGWKGLGILPWIEEARLLPSEDASDIRSGTAGKIKIACLTLSRIANFDDLDPLRLEPAVGLRMIRAGEAIPGDTEIVIIPGSKSTRGDLAYLRRQGWDIDLLAHARRGGKVLGVCGGYQMLGRLIIDPQGADGPPGTSEGLGLLDVSTTMKPAKTVNQVSARCARSGSRMQGYEIHMGLTRGPDCSRPFALIDPDGETKPDGACSVDGRVCGTYLHGCFSSDSFRRSFLGLTGRVDSAFNYGQAVELALDRVADQVAKHLDIDALLELAG